MQCRKFHALEQFHGQRKSCRKALQHHNERRRNPGLLRRREMPSSAFREGEEVQQGGTTEAAVDLSSPQVPWRRPQTNPGHPSNSLPQSTLAGSEEGRALSGVTGTCGEPGREATGAGQ